VHLPAGDPGFSASQVGQDGEHPAVVGVGLGEAELVEDALDVLLDGAPGDEERLGDRAVGASFCYEGEDLALARGEGGEPVVAPAAGEELADDLGVEATSRTAATNSGTSATRSLRR
jgi:hypothetical protein